jgi:K+-sensing histidine kinase KdpD
LNVHLSNNAVKSLLNVTLQNLETYDENSSNPSIHKKVFIIKKKAELDSDHETTNYSPDEAKLSFLEVLKESLNMEIISEKGLSIKMMLKKQQDQPQEYRRLHFSLTNLMFNDQECKVATFRDVTEKKQLGLMKETNKLLHMLTSSVTHEMVTPLKCMISFAAIVLKELQNSSKRKEAELIITTAKLLLS